MPFTKKRFTIMHYGNTLQHHNLFVLKSSPIAQANNTETKSEAISKGWLFY